jgi:hypothetical protein
MGKTFETWFAEGGIASQLLLAVAAVVLVALLWRLWLYRAASVRRWQAVLDAYAVREIGDGPRARRRLS